MIYFTNCSELRKWDAADDLWRGLRATVTSSTGGQTPTGTVEWTTDGSGNFEPNPCTLAGGDGTATCSTTYTPDEVGDGSHLVTAAYSGDANLPSSSGTQPVTVNPRPITVTADPQSKTFGDLDLPLTYQITSGSLVFSDTFTGNLTREPGEDAGTYAILQGTLALSADYDLTFVEGIFTINKADPTCEITPYAVSYDGEPHSAAGACTGVLSEPLDGLDLSGTAHSQAGVYTDPWAFADVTGNYNNLSGTITDSITPVELTIMADAQSRIYGEPDPEFTFQVISGSLVPGDVFTGALARDLGEDVGTYAILQGTLVLSPNYVLTYMGGTLTITPRAITVSANPQTKFIGQPDPELTYMVTDGSLVPGDTFTGTLVREPGEHTGTYAILQGTLVASANYELTFVGNTLTIPGARIWLPLIIR
jgi:hypothetical protein